MGWTTSTSAHGKVFSEEQLQRERTHFLRYMKRRKAKLVCQSDKSSLTPEQRHVRFNLPVNLRAEGVVIATTTPGDEAKGSGSG